MPSGRPVYIILFYYKGIPAIYEVYSSHKKAAAKIQELLVLRKSDVKYKLLKMDVLWKQANVIENQTLIFILIEWLS